MLLALRTIARRVLQLTAEERELAREIEKLTRKLAPQLLDQPGVGRTSAAQVVLSWSHQGRLPTEAAFARLAGAAPIPASSGQTIRYRLDRSGDRKLNRALHMILVTRKRSHPATIAYIERRIQEGKTRREANRCLKRYLARSLYRLLENAATDDLTNIEASLVAGDAISLRLLVRSSPDAVAPRAARIGSEAESRARRLVLLMVALMLTVSAFCHRDPARRPVRQY